MDRLHGELSALVDSTIAGKSAEQLTCAPDGKWSAAQILEHLALSYRLNAISLKRTLTKGIPPIPKATMSQRFARFVVLKLGRFPAGRKSPAAIVPKSTAPVEEVLAELRENLANLDAALAEAAKNFGPRTPLSEHPILGPFSVADWHRFHVVHTRHHVRQIKERCAAHAD